MNEISLPNTTDTPAEHRTMLTIVLVLGWVMTLFTFSVPGREAPASLSSLDVVALAKVGSRGVCLLAFSWMLLRLWSDPRRSQVVSRLWPLGLFAVWCLASTLWSPLKAVSLGQAGSMVVLLLLGSAPRAHRSAAGGGRDRHRAAVSRLTLITGPPTLHCKVLDTTRPEDNRMSTSVR